MNTAAETTRTAEAWVFGPLGQIWAASDVALVDGKWRELVREPRIVASVTNRADGPMVAAAPDLYEALPDLSHVISWLENGCEKRHAIAELRIYQTRIDKARAKARGEAR